MAASEGRSVEEQAAERASRRETTIAIAIAAVGALAIVGLSFARFSDVPELPAKPPAPVVDKDALTKMDKQSAFLFKANLDEDIATYGVARITPEELARPFPYEQSEVAQRLTAESPPIETGMLRVSVRGGRLERRSRTGSMTSDHYILRIENKTDAPLAYRVKTSVGNDTSCAGKAVLDHNALAIPAHGTIERTECFRSDGRTVLVQSIEAMKLPALSFNYVSRLEPMHIGLDARTSAGHVAPKGTICSTIPQQVIVIGMDKGTTTWRDVIDFYARHRCETYDFPAGYKAVTEGKTVQLPATGSQ